MSTHKRCTQKRSTVHRLYDVGSSGNRICRDERQTSSVPVESIGKLHNVMGNRSEEEMFKPNFGRSFSFHGARVGIGGYIEGNSFRLRVRSLNDLQIRNHSCYVQEVDSSPYFKEFEDSLFEEEDEVSKFSPVFHIEIESSMEKTCDSSNSLNLQFTLSREQDESTNYFILQQETDSKEWKDITNECRTMEGSQAGIEIPVKKTSKIWVIHLKQSLSSLKNSLLALVHGRVLFHVLLYYQYLKTGRKIKLRIVGINEELYQNPKQLRTAMTIAEEDGFLKLEEESPKQILRKGYLLSYYKNNECTKDLGKFSLGKNEVKKNGDWLTHSFDVNELNNNLKVDVTDKDGNIQWSFDLNEIICDKVMTPENGQDRIDSKPEIASDADEVCDQDLDWLAQHLNKDVEKVARHLKVDQAEIDAIKQRENSVDRQNFKILNSWRQATQQSGNVPSWQCIEAVLMSDEVRRFDVIRARNNEEEIDNGVFLWLEQRVASFWDHFAQILEVPDYEINALRSSYQSCEERCKALMQRWRQRTRLPVVDILIKALEHDTIRHNELANEMKEKFCLTDKKL